MVVRLNRSMALALVLSMTCSSVHAYDATITNVLPGETVTVSSNLKSKLPALTFQDVVNQVKNNPLLYSSLFITALMVYRFESKGPCDNISYDFNTLMRGDDSYMAKLKRAVAWFDRYIIGQPYKSKSVKAKDGDLVISDAQEALGVMGIAQSNLKPALVGIGSAYFLNDVANGCKSKDKIDGMAWALLAIVFGLK